MRLPFRLLVVVCACAALAADAVAADDTVGMESRVIMNAAVYATSEAAQRAFKPIEEKSPPVESIVVGGKRVLRLPANFAANANWRVAWDITGHWDLAGARDIAVSACTAGADSARMGIYLHSGNGWYRASFQVDAAGAVARIPRKAFEPEDDPGDWDRIDIVRIAVMRAEDGDFSVLLSDLRAVITQSAVAVYQNDEGISKQSGIPRYVRVVADSLDRLGVDYELVSDDGVAAGRLAGKKVAILPLNPVLPKGVPEALRGFVAAGGRLIVCHSLPRPLDELLDVHAGEAVNGNPGGKLETILYQEDTDAPSVRAGQQSWMAHIIYLGARAKAAATWLDAQDNATKMTAIARGPAGYYIGHVLTDADHRGKDQLLLGMLAELWPEVRLGVYAHARSSIGRALGFKDVAALRAAALGNVKDRAVKAAAVNALLARADAQAAAAAKAEAQKDHAAAYRGIVAASELYTQAFATSVPPVKDEFRAVWCHSPTGVRGRTWDEAMKTLADSGINAIIVNMSWGNSAAYPSKVLPLAAEAAGKDQLAECLAAGRKHGVAVHVWRVDWRLSRASAKEQQELKAQGRLQRNQRGVTLDWLCPSNETNRKLEVDAMLEVVKNYDVAGIHFDYIRYPGGEGCYCDTCRAKFEARIGRKVANWPWDVTREPLREQYLQFRRDNITTIVAAVGEQSRKIKPKVQISAAVFPDWPGARVSVAQEWPLWTEKGYLDFVCPMQYTREAGQFDSTTQRSLKWVNGRVPVMTGIGATLGLSPEGTLRQVLISRARGAAGFVLFNYDTTLAEEHLPLLKASVK